MCHFAITPAEAQPLTHLVEVSLRSVHLQTMTTNQSDPRMCDLLSLHLKFFPFLYYSYFNLSFVFFSEITC